MQLLYLLPIRIEHFRFEASTMMKFHPHTSNEEAGMIIMQNNNNHYRFVQSKENGQDMIKLIKREGGNEQTIVSVPWNAPQCILKLKATELEYQFYIGESEDKLQPTGEKQDPSINSTNKAGGFIGPFIGMYASSNNHECTNRVTFEYFDYQPL